VLFLPAQLQQLGLPGYVAGPIGLLSQMMVALGVVQFLANRRYD